jgi:chitinase
MKREISGRWLSIFLAVVMPLLSAICSAAQTPMFSVHVLGDISGGTAAGVTGINNAGDAVGEVAGSAVCLGACAVIWREGAPTLLGTVAGASGDAAEGINNSGQVSGVAYMSGATDLAVVWNNGTPTLLPAPSPQYSQTFASSINNAGQVAGTALELDNRGQTPLVWNGSTPTILGLVPGYKTGRATGINNNGLIVGEICCDDLYPEAVVWRGTTPTLLPRLQASGGATTGGEAVAVNDLGLIVGELSTTGSYVYAVAWENGVVTNLGWVGAGTSAAPTAVNIQGVIVGKSTIEGPAIEHAALWSRVGAAPQDLNTLISASQAAEFELIDATGINDSCTIAANGRAGKTGVYVALLLTLINPSNCVNGL